MSWHDKHEQDKQDREDEAVREEARALGGCGNCKHARFHRKIITNCVELVVDCYGHTRRRPR